MGGSVRIASDSDIDCNSRTRYEKEQSRPFHREIHLGVESTSEIGECYKSMDPTKECDLAEESVPPNHAYGMAQITPVSITLSKLALGSCTSENPPALRNSGPFHFLGIGSLRLSPCVCHSAHPKAHP